MVKKIKFALEMKDGFKVRTLEELRRNFDLEKVVEYFVDGRLERWLEDRYYEKEVNDIRQLNTTEPDVNALCNILNVPHDKNIAVDVTAILRKREKLDKLKQITSDEAILKSVDCVAFTQEELENIINKGQDRIYLYGQNFVIPAEKKNRMYLGIGENTTATIDVDSADTLTEQRISFYHVNILQNNADKTLNIMKKKDWASSMKDKGNSFFEDRYTNDVDLTPISVKRPLPKNEKDRLLHIMGNVELDKNVLSDTSLYPEDQWKDLLYILLQRYPVCQSVPCRWNEFIKFRDIAQVHTDKQYGDGRYYSGYFGRYCSGYTWYEIVYEFIRYFGQNEPTIFLEKYPTRKSFEKESAGYNDIDLKWGINVFCEIYSRIHYERTIFEYDDTGFKYHGHLAHKSGIEVPYHGIDFFADMVIKFLFL